jgi:prefoldin subunit 5
VIGSEGYFVEPSCVDAIEALKSHSNRLQQQLAQAKAEIAQLKTLYEADMGRTLPEVER